MHLHSYSFRFHFLYQDDFDIFHFIELAAEQGFSGVNISANGPGYRHLGGTTAPHFDQVRQALLNHCLNAELDTSDTRPEHLKQMLQVADAIGAQQLRVYTRYQGEKETIIAQTIRDLTDVASLADTLGINIVLENHEDFTGGEIRHILNQVNQPRIRALFDYGNSQMLREDPFQALEAMQPYVTAVHMKDHLILRQDNRLWVQGVALGQGNLPIIPLTQKLLDARLKRFCFENVWAYVAPMQDTGCELPESPCFQIVEGQTKLSGDQLLPQEAITGELQVFEEGWHWLRQALAEAQIYITSH